MLGLLSKRGTRDDKVEWNVSCVCVKEGSAGRC
jgi:hypothetical protein